MKFTPAQVFNSELFQFLQNSYERLLLFNDKTSLYEYKFSQEISKITNKISKLPRTAEKNVSFLQEKSFFVVPKVSFFLEVLVLNFLNTGFLEKISLVVIEAVVTIVTIFVQFKNVTTVT